MADPTRPPSDNSDRVDAAGNPIPMAHPRTSRWRVAPWVWIVAIIVLLLIIWAFFGITRQNQEIHHTLIPAAAASVR